MGTRSRRPEVYAVTAAVALLLATEWLGQSGTTELAETAAWVSHTHEVEAGLETLLVDVLQAESARRGHALTGDEAQLGPFWRAHARAKEDVAHLRALVKDNPGQSARLDDVARAVDDRLDSLVTAVKESSRVRDPALEREHTRVGTQHMDRVRAGIDALMSEEQRLLVERKARSERSLARARYLQLLGTFVTLGLFLFATLRLRREITRRRASEALVRANEQSLETTLYSIADGFIATDAAGRIERMNAVAETLTGYSIAEARGRSYQEIFALVHETTEKVVVNPVTQALTGEVAEIVDEAVLVAKDGTKRRVSDTAAPIRDASGALVGAVLVFRDITKQLEDARALRRVHAFLDAVFESIPLMLFVKDAKDLAFVRINRAGEELIGAKREELIGKTDFAFFPVDEAKAFIEKDREVLRAGALVEIPEEPLTTADGLRWLHTRKVPVALTEDGEAEYLLGISEDITERRRAEASLRAARDAVEVANRELEAFSYSVAHDLRAPLRSIDGFSKALLDDYAERLDAEGKDYLDRVRRAAQRMGELIDDLLALARVSRSDVVKMPIDLSTMARDVGETARKQRNEAAELVVQEGLSAVADARLVKILLENLLANAFKFSSKREDARVEIGSVRQNGAVAFFVKDNGAGFDVASAKKLFSAFQRYHRPTEYEGTGIGLATAERIVSRHGGRIWAESTPGEGATFFFTLERIERIERIERGTTEK